MALCPVISLQDLEKNLSSRKSPVTVKFFASWCGSCKSDLEALRGKAAQRDLVLIAAYDDEASTDEVLKHFDVKQACYRGDTVARKLGVRHLPRTFVFQDGKFNSK